MTDRQTDQLFGYFRSWYYYSSGPPDVSSLGHIYDKLKCRGHSTIYSGKCLFLQQLFLACNFFRTDFFQNNYFTLVCVTCSGPYTILCVSAVSGTLHDQMTYCLCCIQSKRVARLCATRSDGDSCPYMSFVGLCRTCIPRSQGVICIAPCFLLSRLVLTFQTSSCFQC